MEPQPIPESARDLLSRNQDIIGDRPVIVIEAGYFDMRAPFDAGRVGHIHDAFRLYELVSRERPHPGVTIQLVAFVNDLSRSETLCGIAACHQGSTIVDGATTEVASYVAAEFEFAMRPLSKVHVFGMRETRNRATKSIKQALLRGLVDDNGVIEEGSEEYVTSIYSQWFDQRSLIACRTRGKAPIPRCAGIMAQHYCDVFDFASECLPGCTGVVFFDFNLLTEAVNVRSGAESCFAIRPWPPRPALMVINCVYREGELGGNRLQVTVGP